MSARLYLITLPVYLLIDFVWLGFISKNFYKQQLGFLMRQDVGWVPVIIFYLLFAAALVIFVVSPALAAGSWHKAVLLGAFLGLIAYATYDLTNQATLKDWPLMVTIVDIAWGAFVSGTASLISYVIAVKLGL